MMTETSDTVSTKPLPLKQRTSSRDTRKDYSEKTWISLLRLLKPREYFITVDHFSIWRRHLAWAMEDGADLRAYISQRYASNMVFMSLLLGAALNVLFNSSVVTTDMRKNMRNEDYHELSFWVGVTILLSVVLTILSIISTFTAWGMVNAVSDTNAQCILRSSIGQYVAELPGRFIFAAVYSFLLWVILFCFVLLPAGVLSVAVVVITLALFVHVVVVFSAFGRIIMHTGAMGSERIFEEDFERSLLPLTLHSNLLAKAKVQLESKTSIMRQYRFPPKPLTRSLSADSFSSTNTGDKSSTTQEPPYRPQRRKNSAVRFADNLLASSSPVVVDSPLSTIARSPSAAKQGNIKSSRPPRPGALKVPGFSSISNPSAENSVASIEEWLQGSNSHSSDGDHETLENRSTPTHAAAWANANIEATTTTDGAQASSVRRSSLLTKRTRNSSLRSNADSDSLVISNEEGFVSQEERKSGGSIFTKTSTNDEQSETGIGNKDVASGESLGTDDDLEGVTRGAVNVGGTLAISHGGSSEDDKFYEEYGDLFDPEHGSSRGHPSKRVGAQCDSLPGASEKATRGVQATSETQPLLRNDGLQSNRYDTTSQIPVYHGTARYAKDEDRQKESPG